jgi:hypothetical protein
MKRTLTNAALQRLRAKYPKRRISKRTSPAILIRQMKPIWADVCKDGGVSPEEYPLPDWDRVARAIGRRRD